MYKVYESIGNFAEMVFQTDNYYEAQDYLLDRFANSDEEDEELFMSYFQIEEA